MSESIIFFTGALEWRNWLDEHHRKEAILWVGFYKKNSSKRSMTWPESVDEALCYGWIDGIRKSIDENSYKIRFTPRKAGSVWSSVNISRMEELEKLGLIKNAGREAYQKRKEAQSEIYAYEQTGDLSLEETDEQQFRANAAAWQFFSKQAPSYRKTAIWWVISAKREDTRKRRLLTLIEDAAQGRRLGHLTREPNKS